MSYIGKPLATNGVMSQSLLFNGAGPYTMIRSPGKADAMEVFLGGVFQRPFTDYDINDNQLTFFNVSGIPTDGTVAIILVFLGFAAPIGVVSDNAIGTTKIVDKAVIETKLGFNVLSEGYGATRSVLTPTSGSITPNFLTSQYFDLAVSGNFTLNLPQVGGTDPVFANIPAGATAGTWVIDCTNTGVGPWTLTAGTGITILPGNGFDGITGVKNRIEITLTSATTATLAIGNKSYRRTKVISASRAIDAASGPVTYTGVGFLPSKVTCYAHIAATLCGSTGIATSAGMMCSYTNVSPGYDAVTNTSFILGSDPAASNKNQAASLTSFNTDGMTVQWTNTLNPAAGTAISLFFLFEE